MKGLRILIADDSDKLLAALKIQLESHGCEVAACSDAYMALAQAQKWIPDVMLLDIRMPAGDGFSVLERMSKLPELREVPVIYMTGDKSSQVDLQAAQLGARGVVHKPIRMSALVKLIDAVTSRPSAKLSGESTEGAIKIFEIPSEPDITRIPEIYHG